MDKSLDIQKSLMSNDLITLPNFVIMREQNIFLFHANSIRSLSATVPSQFVCCGSQLFSPINNTPWLSDIFMIQLW